MDSDFLMMLVFVATALIAISVMRRLMAKSQETSTSSGGTSSSPKPTSTATNQIAEDIKATRTSQVVDAVSILDDLSTTSSNYRHYCELVGTSMGGRGVTAPYSRQQVAYYDIKCYRLDTTYKGGQQETLVAHEHSVDPFFFTDTSCDTPIYVDLESFGNNVILVNSTNHIEGPNSDFAKQFEKNAASVTGRKGGSAYNMVAQSIQAGANALLGATDALRNLLVPWSLQPAFALADGVMPRESDRPSRRTAKGGNLMLSEGRGRGGGRPSSSGRPSTSGRGGASERSNASRPGTSKPKRRDDDDDDDHRVRPSQQSHTYVQMGYGGLGYNRPPQHLDDFMGAFGGGPWVMGGGTGTHRPTNTPSSADIILGMGLGALLSSMASAEQQASPVNTTSTFRGYRLVENVVPLSSPIYCIGEIYYSGSDVYMGRSLAKDYSTSYFATKPESEVLSAIS